MKPNVTANWTMANTRVNVSSVGVPRCRRPNRTSNTAPMTVPTSIAQCKRPYGVKVGAAVGESTSATLGVSPGQRGRWPFGQPPLLQFSKMR